MATNINKPSLAYPRGGDIARAGRPCRMGHSREAAIQDSRMRNVHDQERREWLPAVNEIPRPRVIGGGAA